MNSMPKKLQPTSLLVLAAILLGALLSACGANTPAATTPQPTQDISALRTEIAATVLAQCAQVCALTPSPTTPPTETPTPTETQSAEPTLSPTVLSGTPGSATGDQAKWVSQTIADGTRFAPNETFTMTWRLQNVGTTTWTEGYRLRFYSGELFGAPREIALDRDVAPNEAIDISIAMKAPAQTGRYRSDWVMSTGTLYNFNQPVYLEIVVGNPPTSTTTVTVAPTATNTPQELAATATP